MDATDLLEDAALSSEHRAIVIEAFEAAWAQVKSHFAGEEDREYARTKLAGIMRMIARQEIVDCQHLMDAALAAPP